MDGSDWIEEEHFHIFPIRVFLHFIALFFELFIKNLLFFCRHCLLVLSLKTLFRKILLFLSFFWHFSACFYMFSRFSRFTSQQSYVHLCKFFRAVILNLFFLLPFFSCCIFWHFWSIFELLMVCPSWSLLTFFVVWKRWSDACFSIFHGFPTSPLILTTRIFGTFWSSFSFSRIPFCFSIFPSFRQFECVFIPPISFMFSISIFLPRFHLRDMFWIMYPSFFLLRRLIAL